MNIKRAGMHHRRTCWWSSGGAPRPAQPQPGGDERAVEGFPGWLRAGPLGAVVGGFLRPEPGRAAPR